MTSILGISAFYHDSAACILKDGKIIEQGKHSNLLKNKGLYYEMWNKQKEIKKQVNLVN